MAPLAPSGGDRQWPHGPARARALTAAIARGDEAALAAFYQEWFDRALRKARAVTKRDEAFCLDVVQDVMLKVARTMRALPDEESVAAWMAQALLTTALDHLRAESRRRRREQRAARVEPTDDGSGHAAQDREEQSAWLSARLAELPAAEQTLIQARFSGGRTLDAAGAVLGITGDAAHGRIARAIGRLKRMAQEWLR